MHATTILPAGIPMIGPGMILAAIWAAIRSALRPPVFAFADNSGGGDGGDGGGGDGGAGAGSGGSGAAGNEPGGDGDDELKEHERLVAEIGEKGAREVLRLRREAAGYRTRAGELEARLKAHEEAELSEAQKAARRAEAAEAEVARANDRVIRAEVRSVARELQAIDADAVYALIDKSAIKVDANGDVKGVKAAVETLLRERPHLKGSGTAQRSTTDAQGREQPGGEVDFNKVIRQMAGRG